MLDPNRVDDNTFVGSHPSKNPPRTFGGQMMAQAFVAASRTLTRDCPPGAISAHFIAGGDPAKDLEFHVVRLRDERRFANRRVDVMQDGELLTTAMVSFVDGGRGLEHGDRSARGARTVVPAQDRRAARRLRGNGAAVRQRIEADRMAVHQRPGLGDAGEGRAARPQPGVAQGRGPMPDDPVLHTAALVYSSDTTVLDSIITTHGLSWGYDRIFAATVNHRCGSTGRCGSTNGCCIRLPRR